MRKSVVFVVTVSAFAGLAAGCANAYENFIPMGTGYSTEIDSLPSFDTDAGQVSVTTDVLETEVYRKNREAAEADSQFRMFQSGNEIEGGSTFIDY